MMIILYMIIKKMAENYQKENRNVVIVGGSGLYIKALLYDYKLEETYIKRVDYSEYSNKELKDIADTIDENNKIHVNNRQRLERYITFYNETGSTINKTEDINKRVENGEELENIIDELESNIYLFNEI